MSVEITEAELFAEIDKLERRKIVLPFTDVQIRLIRYALEKGVSWRTLTGWFNAKFDADFRENAMRAKYHAEKDKYI